MKIKLSMKQGVKNSLPSVLCCLFFVACNQDMMPDDNALRTSANTGTVYMQDFTPAGNETAGTEVMLTDKRDGISYRCIKMADGRWWMGENLKYNVTGSVIYNNETANLDTYGRLYKWQEAVDAVPANWDLPTDDEWKALEMALGMTQADADATTVWRNSGNVGTQLKGNGSSGMDMPLSGYQHTNGTYFYLGTYGRYWTSTESGVTAFDRDVYSTKAGVYRGAFSKAYRYSVRCILQVKETTQYMQEFVPNPTDSVGTEVMLTDKRDNTVYRCIKMADGRWWMGENLRARFGTFVEGQPTETYGLLYDWDSSKDYIPEGWNLPSDAEWTALGEALGGVSVAGKKMKSTSGWETGNGTNESGFNGFPGGYCYAEDKEYYDKGYAGRWWSSENYGCWHLLFRTRLFGPRSTSGLNWYSVRCILNVQ